jgi:hypothetical protein
MMRPRACTLSSALLKSCMCIRQRQHIQRVLEAFCNSDCAERAKCCSARGERSKCLQSRYRCWDAQPSAAVAAADATAAAPLVPAGSAAGVAAPASATSAAIGNAPEAFAAMGAAGAAAALAYIAAAADARSTACATVHSAHLVQAATACRHSVGLCCRACTRSARTRRALAAAPPAATATRQCAR